jgi:hypothetical protein
MVLMRCRRLSSQLVAVCYMVVVLGLRILEGEYYCILSLKTGSYV